MSDPQILFLDEPTAGLDPVATREVHELIDGLRGRRSTIFLTTHRLEEAERLCDRVAILNGTLRTVGRPEELERQHFRRELLVQTAVPLTDPERLFGHVPGVNGWQAEGTSSYLLAQGLLRCFATSSAL